ncbi:MAG: hypothetical protein QW128_00850 [Thermoprotei archaeon]
MVRVSRNAQINSKYLDELLKILKDNNGRVSIEHLLDWIKNKGGSMLVLYALLSEAEKLGKIVQIGIWPSSDPLFQLPREVILKQPVQEQVQKAEKVQQIDSILEKELETAINYLRKYFSVGEIRFRLELGNKIHNIDKVLKELESRGLIEYNRDLGVINATSKLLSMKSAQGLHELM